MPVRIQIVRHFPLVHVYSGVARYGRRYLVYFVVQVSDIDHWMATCVDVNDWLWLLTEIVAFDPVNVCLRHPLQFLLFMMRSWLVFYVGMDA